MVRAPEKVLSPVNVWVVLKRPTSDPRNPLSLMDLPDTPSNSTTRLSTDEAGPTTSPVPDTVAYSRAVAPALTRKTCSPVPSAVRPVPPLATVNVPVVPPSMGSPVHDVRVPLDGVPRAGVTSVGLSANTKAPEPVSPVTAAARLADDGVARNVATPVPRPAMPVDTGRPVQLVRVPDAGVPRVGVTSAGLLAKTRAPVPVSSVTAARRLALEGVARNVATPVPRPEMPVLTGRPVQLVKVPDVGVPRAPL
jgi:hypothetical protein